MFLSVDPFVRLVNAEWMEDLTFGSILIRIAFALVCGCLLGAERAIKQQAAGFRTYTLVCLGSAVAMMTNQFITEKTNMGDSARLGAQVISGIGFLGAGTIIITSRNQIRGLTTAAGLWACACLGLSIGVGFYTLTVFSLITIMIVFSLIPFVERSVIQRSPHFGIHIEFDNRQNLKEFINYCREMGIRIDSTDHNPAYSSSGLSVYTISMTIPDKSKGHAAYMNLFQALPYVNHVEETR